MKALVTGATGFVGTALCRALLERGLFVRAAVRDRTRPVAASEVVPVGGIDGATDWIAALEGIDVVFHLAALAHIVQRPDRSPPPYDRVNADGTRRLAAQAAAAGVSRLVLLSSLKVNGETSPPGGLRESDPLQPSEPYALSKARAEAAVTAIAAETALRAVIIRPPLVYGPGVRANFLELVRAVDRGQLLPIGAVNNRRSFIYVGNLCSALHAAAVHPAAPGEIFLVSDGEALSTAALARRIGAALGRRPRLLSLPLPLLRVAAAVVGHGDAVEKLTASLVVDDRKIRTRLGWTPPFTLDEGLVATVGWYRGLGR